ncbi:MAG: ABC transporter substrate-binding protein [Actinomycetes bacterium]|jgi:polar amino acid transport system substrate-binding protein|nr:ABC transporter substrate-binding protein [Actinomycetes bacterium]
MFKKAWVLLLVVALVAGAIAVVGCKKAEVADTTEPEATETAETQGGIADITQLTLVPGKLTVATGEPAYYPWVIDDKPETGEGFEPAVIYAVAEKLGFAKEDVVWTRSQFEAAIAPGPKDFDLNIQQFSITDERKQAVDFSSPYYITSQALVTNSDNAYAGAKTLAELEGAIIGAASGTTSLRVAEEKFADSVNPYNDNDAAIQALNSGQIDAVVLDVPTAYYATAAQLDDGKIIGIIDGTEGGDELGILLAKDSPLTDAVSAAVDELRAESVLSQLAEQWLAANADAVILK